MRAAILFSLAGALFCASFARAAEIYTNGVGGGDWDDATTWRGGAAPGPEDSAVISRDDQVVFARNDAEAVTCLNLYVDPKGSLVFKQRAGVITMALGGTLESYGSILLDGTRGSDDVMTIRFINEELKLRHFKVLKGGSLILAGREREEGIESNVRIVSHPANEKEKDPATRLTAEDGAGIDLRRARFENIPVYINKLDNTGAEYNERVNVTENTFVGQSQLYLTSCDTPLIADNYFERNRPGSLLQPGALALHSCPLAEVRGNTIKGRYYHGMHVYGCTDIALIDNTLVDIYIGIYVYTQNGMIQNLIVRNANTGVMLNYMSGAIDGLLTDKCSLPVYHANATAQISNWRVDRLPEKSKRALEFQHGRLVLLNCDVSSDLISLHKNASPPPKDPEPHKPLVQCMRFLVAGVKGAMPPGALVEVKTANPKPPLKTGAADLNVRNSPAPVLSNRLTPLPGTIQSLVVSTWAYGIDRKLIPAPKYTLTVFGPANADGNRPALKSTTVEPADDWYRAKPDDPTATVEVVLP